MITAIAPEMRLTDFFRIWIPRLYPGIKYEDPYLKQKTKTPQGTIEELTWKQACLREMELNWGYSRTYLHFIKLKSPSTPLREQAYRMNQAYEREYGQKAA
jgi:hypothetical protein